MIPIEEHLARLGKKELLRIAAKLRIYQRRRMAAIELREAILGFDARVIMPCLQTTWWDRWHNHVYGVATLLGLGISLYLFPWNPDIHPKESERVLALLEKYKIALEQDRAAGVLHRLASNEEAPGTTKTKSRVEKHVANTPDKDYTSLRQYIRDEFGYDCLVIGMGGRIESDSISAKAWWYQLAACIQQRRVPAALLERHDSMVHQGTPFYDDQELAPSADQQEPWRVDMVAYSATEKGWHIEYEEDSGQSFWVR